MTAASIELSSDSFSRLYYSCLPVYPSQLEHCVPYPDKPGGVSPWGNSDSCVPIKAFCESLQTSFMAVIAYRSLKNGLQSNSSDTVRMILNCLLGIHYCPPTPPGEIFPHFLFL